MAKHCTVNLITIAPETYSGQNDCDCGKIEFGTNNFKNPNPGGSHSFSSAFLELTPACNNRCVGCSNVFIENKLSRKMILAQAPLPISDWKGILGKLMPNLKHINLTGGEPTLYKFFPEFIDLLDMFQKNYTIFTNARWQDPLNTISTIQQANFLTGLLISLHGKDSFTHEAFTIIRGSFEEAVENIKRATKHELNVTISTIITKFNYDQTEEIVRLVEKLGVKQVVFNRYIGKQNDESAPSPTQLRYSLRAIERLRVKGKNIRLSVTVPQCFHPTSATGCGAGDNFITIDPWGNVKPCNHTPMILGNLLQDSLKAVMASRQLAYWRELPTSKCKSCSVLSICGGGCRAEAMLNDHTYDSLTVGPISAGSDPNILFLPEHLHPIATQVFSEEDFKEEINLDLRKAILSSLNGQLTLKSLGENYGQQFLNLVGTMHQEGVVEFV